MTSTKLTHDITTRLSTYMRLNFNLYIRPLFIKEIYEVCESNDALELHHDDKHFSHILNEALELLELEYHTYAYDYTEQEIQILKHIVTGMHLQIKYKTLCRDCHIALHAKMDKDMTNYYKNLEMRRMKKKKEEENIEINSLVPYLEYNIGSVLLTLKDRETLINFVNVRNPDNNRVFKGITHINNKLKELGYYVKQFETSRLINGKKKNFKSAWRILRIDD